MEPSTFQHAFLMQLVNMKSSSTIKLALIGLGISFIGTLPLGVLNLTALRLSVTDSQWVAIRFSIGALLVEMFYVILSLKVIGNINHNPKLYKLANWFSFFLLLVFAIYSFMQAAEAPVAKMDFKVTHQLNGWNLSTWPFLGGMIMSALNPLQIPFWLGWSTLLMQKQLLNSNPYRQLFYVLGIGTGTFAGNLVFIFGGQWLFERMGSSQLQLHLILGTAFLLGAIFQGWKLYKPSIKNDQE